MKGALRRANRHPGRRQLLTRAWVWDKRAHRVVPDPKNVVCLQSARGGGRRLSATAHTKSISGCSMSRDPAGSLMKLAFAALPPHCQDRTRSRNGPKDAPCFLVRSANCTASSQHHPRRPPGDRPLRRLAKKRTPASTAGAQPSRRRRGRGEVRGLLMLRPAADASDPGAPHHLSGGPRPTPSSSLLGDGWRKLEVAGDALSITLQPGVIGAAANRLASLAKIDPTRPRSTATIGGASPAAPAACAAVRREQLPHARGPAPRARRWHGARHARCGQPR